MKSPDSQLRKNFDRYPVFAITYKLEGIIQGVGFRPTVYRLARKANLGGWIKNTSGAVSLCLIGDVTVIAHFITTLHKNLPPQAKLLAIQVVDKKEICDKDNDIPEFEIIESSASESKNVVIPADLAMCSDCRKEISNPADRRYGYPFTTCTNCGPRYTVVNDMPYDRERTTLCRFPLCEKCLEEYTDPNNRRFHAESTACPECGPSLFLTDPSGKLVETENALLRARREIAWGNVVAVRGIGGFLLAVDAFNYKALTTLRSRKNRPHKPFAVMCRDMETVFKYCKFTPEAVKLLTSPEAPIVILDLLEASGELPVGQLSPDTATLGVMLPYSPLHHLLFNPLESDPVAEFDILVMTSGNRGGEPICITNEEAFDRLGHIADFILCHNREINLRNDDSLCTIQMKTPQIWRRARGFAPQPVKLKNTYIKDSKTVLAMGSELKNAIAVAYVDNVVLSPHIGDLEAPEAVAGMGQIVKTFPKFLEKTPDVIAVDLHPDMASTRLGRKIAAENSLPVVEVQHHHAHAVACMVEHGLGNAVALVFDGTGLGPDGRIWGAEALHVNFATDEGIKFKRYATFAPVPLPGGDAAVKHPVRQLIGRFYEAGVNVNDELLKRYGLKEDDVRLWLAQCRKQLNTPLTHATGRVFDSVSAALGLAAETTTYEGQSAIRLEAVARTAQASSPRSFHYRVVEEGSFLQIDWSPLFAGLAKVFTAGQAIDKPGFALAFHDKVAEAAVRMAEFSLERCRTSNVVLSGGVFMNKILTESIVKRLRKEKLQVFIHNRIPPNDGCIALGQAVIAGM